MSPDIQNDSIDNAKELLQFKPAEILTQSAKNSLIFRSFCTFKIHL